MRVHPPSVQQAKKNGHRALAVKEDGLFIGWCHPGEQGANAQKSQTPQWCTSQGF